MVRLLSARGLNTVSQDAGAYHSLSLDISNDAVV